MNGHFSRAQKKTARKGHDLRQNRGANRLILYKNGMFNLSTVGI